MLDRLRSSKTCATRPRSLKTSTLLPSDDRHAGRLLAAVLQRVEAVVGELGDVLVGRPDAEDAALLAHGVLGLEQVERVWDGRHAGAPRGGGWRAPARSSVGGAGRLPAERSAHDPPHLALRAGALGRG